MNLSLALRFQSRRPALIHGSIGGAMTRAFKGLSFQRRPAECPGLLATVLGGEASSVVSKTSVCIVVCANL